MNEILNGVPESRLSVEDEQRCARVIQKIPGLAHLKAEAREMLVMHAMKEAFFYARRCCRQRLPDDEIFSLSYDALCRAAKNFKPGRLRFFSYAKIYVRGAICKTWKSKDVVKNSSSHETLAITDHYDWTHDPEGDYLSHDCYLSRMQGNPKKLAPDSEDPDFPGIHSREVWHMIEPVLKSRLSARERRVLEMKYNRGMNFREIGDALGVSRSATQATHSAAIEKLRGALTGKAGLL